MPRAITTDFVFNAIRKGKGTEQTRDSVDDLNRALDGTAASADSAGAASGRASGMFAGMGKAAGLAGKAMKVGLAGGAGVAIGAAGLALKDFTSLDTAMNSFSAKTGVYGADLEEYEGIAKRVFASNWGDSLEDVVNTMGQVRAVTGATGSELETLTTYTEIFTDTFDTDVNETLRAADTIMENFGGTGTEVFDLLTVGMQQTGDPGQDLLDTFNEYSGNFSEMGFSAEQMLNLLNQGLQAGARNTDDIADGMREFQIRLKDGTSDLSLWSLGLDGVNAQYKRGEIDAASMFESVIQGLADIEDPIKRNQLGVEIFGTKWEDMGESAWLALDPTSSSLEDMEGATEKAGDALSRGLGPAWSRFTRTVRMGLVTALGPFIEQGLGRLTDFLTTAGNNLDALIRGIERFGLSSEWVNQKLQQIFGPDAGKMIFGFISTMSEAFNDLKEAFERGGLREVGSTILGAIADGITGIPGWVKDHIITPIVTYLANVDWADVQSKAQDLLAKLLLGSLVLGVWVYDNVIKPITSYLSNVNWAGVKTRLGDVLEKMLGLAGAGLASMGVWAWDTLISPLISYLTNVNWTGLAGRLGDLLERFLGWYGAAYASMGVWAWNELVSPLISYLSTVNWTGLGNRLLSILEKFIGFAGAGLANMGVWAWNNIISPLISYLSNVNWVGVANRLIEVLGQLLGVAASGLASVGEWAWQNLITPIIETISSEDTWKALFSAAQGFGSQIWEGMQDALNGIGEKIYKYLVAEFAKIKNWELIPGSGISLDNIGGAIGSVLPGFAGGGILDGIGIVGEDGPELAITRQPTQIVSHQNTVAALREAFVPAAAVPAYASAGAGGGMIFTGNIVLPGVQNVRDMRRALQREGRRHNDT